MMGKQGTNTAIGGGGFHHLAMRVYDLDTSVRFYCEALATRGPFCSTQATATISSSLPAGRGNRESRRLKDSSCMLR